MKKIAEMTGNEKIAYRNIKGVFNWEVGGWYNCVLDGCEEYIPDTEEEAKAWIYDESLVDTAGPGWFHSGRAPKEMRFAGTEFIKECIDHLFRIDGDVAVIRDVKKW